MAAEDDITQVKEELGMLRRSNASHKGYLKLLDDFLGVQVAKD